jgi:uncharacterized membrane protein
LLPCLIDGIAQYYYGYESTNFRRGFTGCLAGFALGSSFLGPNLMFNIIKVATSL